jgi:predicted phage terminase large subunit-like protein
VDALVIEAKQNGFSVAQEIIRLCGPEEWNTLLDPVKGDKVARAHSVQHLLRNGLVYAPDRAWSDTLIGECATFPKGQHDDATDSFVLGLSYLRRTGLIATSEEAREESRRAETWSGGEPEPLYDV